MVSGASFCSHSTSSTENGNDNIRQRCSRSLVKQQISANNQSHILTHSTHTNTFDVVNSCTAESNRSDIHEEKLLLSPFSPPNLLDLSGDLDLHLRCLQKIQYHLESMFDGFVQLIQEAFVSGLIDEDSFKIPTNNFQNTDERPPGLMPVASVDADTRNLSPVSNFPSTGNVSHKSHTEDQVNNNQIQTSLPWDVHNNQHGYVYSDMNMVDNQNPGTTSEGLVRHYSESRELPIHHPQEVQFSETMALSPCISLPHCIGNGQGNLFQEFNTQPFPPATEVYHSNKTKQDGNLEFGSFGPIPFSAPCAKFAEAFPLPTSKGPGETESRPDGFYQLRDEADFPPLQAGSC